MAHGGDGAARRDQDAAPERAPQQPVQPAYPPPAYPPAAQPHGHPWPTHGQPHYPPVYPPQPGQPAPPYPPQPYPGQGQPYPHATAHNYPQATTQQFPVASPHPAQPGQAPPPPPRDRRILIAVAAGVVIVLLFVAGGFGIAELLSGGEPAPSDTSTAAPTPSEDAPDQSAPPSAPPSGDQVDISARSTDPKPLTLDEVYPGTTIAFNGAAYRIHGKDTVADCRTAADGALGAALAARGCSQVVRATAADESGQYLVTVGIANLPTQADADQIYQLMEDAAENGYFKRLSGTGPAKDFAATRDSVIGSMARGHYVIFAIGARGGTSGASLADEQLKTALKDLRLYSNERITRRSFG